MDESCAHDVWVGSRYVKHKAQHLNSPVLVLVLVIHLARVILARPPELPETSTTRSDTDPHIVNDCHSNAYS